MDTAWTGPAGVAYPALEKDVHTDVVVIGGGLAGVLTAYLLAGAGKKVVLLERDTLGGGVTAGTTAFLTQSIDTALSDMIDMFGVDGARKVWRSGAEAIADFQRIAADTGDTCEMTICPARVYAKDKEEFEELKTEAQAANRLGFPVELKHDGALSFPNAGYLEIPGQAKFDPLLFLRQVSQRAAQSGVDIYEHTEVATLSETGEVVVTTTSGAVVRARDAVVTTHLPFNNPKPTHFKKGPYESYVIEAHTAGVRIPEGIYWDMQRPFIYFRVDRWDDGDRIILGGADHRREIPVSKAKCFSSLEVSLKNLLGGTPYRIIRTWAGPIIESVDGLPLIGPYAPHRYVATAFSGNGMTYAMVSATLFRDRITGAVNPYAELYDPKRSPKISNILLKAREYIGEFFGGAFKSWFAW